MVEGGGIADRSELAPCDRPRRTDGVVRYGLVTGDGHADAAHVLVVGEHDGGERNLVARRSRCHEDRVVADGPIDDRHTS
jgi:hypothetical protein